MKDNLLANLNDKQTEAVSYTNGSLLVLAGAGSGKTRVLTHRAAWLIAQKKSGPENILLLTFTNKAAGEMRERIKSLTSEVPFFTGTFHSFCARLLRQSGRGIGIEPGFLIFDDTDSKDLIKEIVDDLNLPRENYNESAVLSVISDSKNQMLTPLQYAEYAQGEWQEKVFLIYKEYEKKLTEINALDFDDLLLKSVKLLQDNFQTLEGWQNQLTNIFVDEWQDTNKIQYTLTKLLLGRNNHITAVGDASQSIYGWRGADYRNITNLTRDYPNIKVINLERNYRSTQIILDAANFVIKKNTSHPILTLWTDKKEGEKIKIYRAASELDEANQILREVDLLITKGYEYNDIAVLYRTNAQSRVIEEAFLHEGVPYTLVGGVKFYTRKEIKDILSYLRILVNPKDSVSRKRVEKLGKRTFDKYVLFLKEVNPNYPERPSEKPKWENLTTLELLDLVVQKSNYLDKFKKETEENVQRLENIKELRSVATEFPVITDFLENVALIEAEQDEHGKIRSSHSTQPKNAVTLMTLHAAKGLEFSAVFMVGMEEGIFPHSRSLFDIKELEEERRLAYVGITRAKKRLFLSFADRRLYFGKRTQNPPSRFLADIPEYLSEGSSVVPEQRSRSSFNSNYFDKDSFDFEDDINF
jgi:DNA helicase-2/ATP-dependent DNA helicase PcrA